MLHFKSAALLERIQKREKEQSQKHYSKLVTQPLEENTAENRITAFKYKKWNCTEKGINLFSWHTVGNRRHNIAML